MVIEFNNKIWIDIVNTPHVHFIHSLISDFSSENLYITTRRKSETLELADQYGLDHHVIGNDHSHVVKKYIGIMTRTMKLLKELPNFDISLSVQNGMSTTVSKVRKKPSILFDDNDYRIGLKHSIGLKLFVKAQAWADYYIVPKPCFEKFLKIIPKGRLISYNGIKEHISVSSYQPDRSNIKEIPFKDYVVLRGEALEAVYVKAESIVENIVEELTKQGYKIVFLPRNKSEIDILRKYDDVFIPEHALNGLDLCYFSQGVITGSGTIAREAAVMNVPSANFFPGSDLLSVDKYLINNKKMFSSRDPVEIVKYLMDKKDEKGRGGLKECSTVKKEVIEILETIID